MVELIEKENGLLIRLTDKEELENLFEKEELGHGVVTAYDVISDYIGNGWDEILPEKIGAITEAPIIGRDVVWDDEGDVENAEAIYWYPNYQIEDPFRVLLETGEVFFEKA